MMKVRAVWVRSSYITSEQYFPSTPNTVQKLRCCHMQQQTENNFEEFLDQQLINCLDENKKLAVQQLDELFELLTYIFTK